MSVDLQHALIVAVNRAMKYGQRVDELGGSEQNRGQFVSMIKFKLMEIPNHNRSDEVTHFIENN